MSSSNAGHGAGRGAGRGRGGNQQNIRRRGAFFSSGGTVPGPGTTRTFGTAASAATPAGEGAFGPASPLSSSSEPSGPTSRPGSSSGLMGPPPCPGSSSGQMGPAPRPSSSSGLMGPPKCPYSSSGPARRPSVAHLDYMEFDDPSTTSTFTGARIGPPRYGPSAPTPVLYGAGPPSAPPHSSVSAPLPVSYGTAAPPASSLSSLGSHHAPPRPTSSTGLGHPNMPPSLPAPSPSPQAIRVPTDALSRFMELKQFMNRLQKATQDCHDLAINPFIPHLNIMEINYGEEFKLELAAFEEACRLLDQLILRERDVMHPLMHRVLPGTMRRAVVVRREVYRLHTSPDTTLEIAVDALMAVFGGLDQMAGGRDVMTEEWQALKNMWLAQPPLFY